MSGLPDGAVEAMARALDEIGAAMQQEGYSLPTSEQIASSMLAALPAGVYVISDGQGTVELSEDEAVARLARSLNPPAWGAEWPAPGQADAQRESQRQARCLLAALSATDTESSS